jgi:hypothetical protein
VIFLEFSLMQTSWSGAQNNPLLALALQIASTLVFSPGMVQIAGALTMA